MDRYSDPKSFFEIVARKKLGLRAGSMHSFLVHQHLYLRQCWSEVEVFFDSTEQEQAVLQKYVNVFCRRATDAIWSQTIVGIAAMTEGIAKRNEKQASVPSLLKLIEDKWDSDEADQKLSELSMKVKNLTFVRHKFIGHYEDKWQPKRESTLITREEINVCLTGIEELLQLIGDHWKLPFSPYLSNASAEGGALDLISIMMGYHGARKVLGIVQPSPTDDG